MLNTATFCLVNTKHSMCSILITIINPRCMCCRVTVVVLCVCVCLSLTKLSITYLVCESKVWRYKVPYGVPNA